MVKQTLVLQAIALFSLLVACAPNPDQDSKPQQDQPAAGSSELPGVGITIRPANSSWIEEQFVTEVVNIGLEELGYTVEEVQQADYAVINLAVANGDMEFTTGFYRLGHEEFFNQAGGEEKLEKMDILVPEGGQQYLLIDKKTADQYEISNIEQLSDPAIAQLFDTDDDGLANIAGCQVGWTCGEIVNHFIKTYGLEPFVEQDQGAYTALLADVLARQQQEQPVLFYAYAPHWVLLQLKMGKDVVPLEVPFTALPDDLASMTETDTTVNGKNFGFPVAQQILLANQQFVDEHPVARAWFKQVEIPVEAMNAESLRIQEGEDTPEDIRIHAEEWVSGNRALFEGWLEEALSTAN